MSAKRTVALLAGLCSIWIVAGLALAVAIPYVPSDQQEVSMFNCFSVSIYIDGIITADHVAYFDVPCDCSLVAVSAAANSASTGGTIDVGSASDTDGYLDGKDIGAQDGAIYDLDDFNGALVTNQGDDYPHLTKGDTVVVTVIDGETSPTGTHVVLYFTPG
jgi:FlaG/FlaF family flagellin (archaellin)